MVAKCQPICHPAASHLQRLRSRPIFWDATIAIATATLIVESIASLKWAFG